MVSTFLKKNFPSIKGSISEREKNFLNKTTPKDEEEDKIISGVISDAEMKLIKSLLPK